MKKSKENILKKWLKIEINTPFFLIFIDSTLVPNISSSASSSVSFLWSSQTLPIRNQNWDLKDSFVLSKREICIETYEINDIMRIPSDKYNYTVRVIRMDLI